MANLFVSARVAALKVSPERPGHLRVLQMLLSREEIQPSLLCSGRTNSYWPPDHINHSQSIIQHKLEPHYFNHKLVSQTLDTAGVLSLVFKSEWLKKKSWLIVTLSGMNF